MIVSAFVFVAFFDQCLVLRTPNAGRNLHFQCFLCFSGNETLDQHLGANLKKHFLQNLIANFLLFSIYFCFFSEKQYKCIFLPVFGVRLTHKLVEIYNICLYTCLSNQDSYLSVSFSFSTVSSAYLGISIFLFYLNSS